MMSRDITRQSERLPRDIGETPGHSLGMTRDWPGLRDDSGGLAQDLPGLMRESPGLAASRPD
jgi:hypothetical protein